MTNKFFNFLCYISLIIVLVIVYFACFKYSYQGYGYPGYRGYHHHHSYWYIGRHDSYYGSSVRENSVSGSRFSQKGIHGGK
ncbi:hypothetical protein IKE67_02335 [bacterium]|nr:hypothetical protein [bacterium]